MVSTQNQVLNILLKSLLEQELISKGTYGAAVSIINSTLEFPEFFRQTARCGEEGEHGCP